MATTDTIEIGIGTEDRAKLAQGLARLLADSYTLYLKTHNYHWNVTGPLFQSLHTMFEEHYTDLAVAVDDVAERIRTLGHRAPGSYREFLTLATVRDSEGSPSADEMVRHLVADHETVARTARAVLVQAEAAGDQGTADVATQRLGVHEKTAWMLRSLLPA